MQYANHFYRGRWMDVPYTSRWLRSPLGHDYVEFVTDHTLPIKGCIGINRHYPEFRKGPIK